MSALLATAPAQTSNHGLAILGVARAMLMLSLVDGI